MAKDYGQKLTAWRPPAPRVAWVLICVLLFVTLTPIFVGLLSAYHQTKTSPWLFPDEFIFDALKFTSIQAGISSGLVLLLAPVFGLSLVFAPPTYVRFATIIRTLIFCLPSVVVATGIILCWGKHGIGTNFLKFVRLDLWSSDWIYSKYSVIAANVLMNLPFASLIVAESIMSIGREKIISVRLLGLSSGNLLRKLIWPVIKPQLFYLSGLTFLLSMGNFGALSILGGSAGSITLEMGIYQALFLNADWISAGVFSSLHTISAILISLVFLAPQYIGTKVNFSNLTTFKDNLPIKSIFPCSSLHQQASGVMTSILDFSIVILVFALFYDAANDFPRIFDANSELFETVMTSLVRSLSYATPVGVCSTIVAWILAKAYTHYNLIRRPTAGLAILLGIFLINIIPGMASAFGYLVLMGRYPDLNFNFFPIIMLHVSLTLPFITIFALQSYTENMGTHFSQLHLTGTSASRWFVTVEWPIMKKNFGVMFVVALSLSINETSVVTMLSNPESPALTTTMIQLMGHYRFADSAVVSSLLVFITAIALFIYSRSERPKNGIN